MCFEPLRAVGVLLMLTISTTGAQTGSSDRNLMPARKDLVALHWPDVTQLETNVREQITASQNELTAAVKDPAISETQLSEAYGRLGQTYHAYSLNPPARECYRNASQLAPKDFRWIYLLGALDRQEGQFDEAISRYRRTLTLRPEYVPALVNLGNVFVEQNQFEDALAAFKAALEIEENTPAAHYGLGQIAMSKRNYAEAVEHFEKTLAQLPSANRVHYSLAMAYRGLGDSKKVAQHLAQQGSVGVRVIDPLVDGLQDFIVGERLLLARANRAIEAQRFAEAAVELRKVLSLKPDSVTARINLGTVLTRLGDRQGAAEQFAEALRIEPDRVNAHYNLAVLLAEQNKHDLAIDHLRSALRVTPNDVNARLILASELAKSGRKDEALVEFSRVVQTDPNNEAALLEQVKLLHRKGEFGQALLVLKKAYSQHPKRGRTVLLLAYLLITSPDPELRDGAQGLELAQLVYAATNGVPQGALVTLALAELGRCDEAAAWQRRMIAATEHDGNTDLGSKLRATLKLYDQAKTCRPTGDASLDGLSFYEPRR
jgi:tetratricopeptide (TPR) repeat protein